MLIRKLNENPEPCTTTYLTYSFDMTLKSMRRDHPQAKLLGTTMLDGYRLMFRGSVDRSLATIEKAEDYQIPVVLWQIPASYEAAIERCCPENYHKIELEGIFEGKATPCIAYAIDEGCPYGIPSAKYMKVLVKRYISWKFCVYPLVKALDESMQALLATFEEG